jgi:hypothetical protein
MFAFLKRAKGNDSKLEKRLLQKRSHEESLDAQTEAAVQKELKKAEVEIRQNRSPFIRDLEITAIVQDKISNIIDVIESRAKEVTQTQPKGYGKGSAHDPILVEQDGQPASSPNTSDNNTHPSKTKPSPSSSTAEISHMKRPDLTWNDRSIGIFLLFHPSIYGLQSPVTRIDNAAKALGTSPNTIRQWVSLKDKSSASNIQIWFGIVKHMKWGTIKKRFPTEWAAQFTLDDDADVTEQLEPYHSIAERSQTIFLTKDSTGKMSNPKARVLVAKKNVNVKFICLGKDNGTRRIERNDKGKARDWIAQTKAVEDFVKGR